jgi:hypothetical protein
MNYAKRLAVPTLSAGLMALSLSAHAGLYGLSSGFPGTIYEIDAASGAATALTTTANTSLVGATFLDGVLYGTDTCGANCFSIDSLDLGTGANTFVSDQDGSANWHGLASDEAAGLLYSIDQDDGGILKSLTPGGVVTSIGTGTGIDGRGMAYDDMNDILYATDSNGGLYTVDVTTGLSTLIGDMGIPADLIGLAYDELADILYANVANDGLYSLNVSTGAATFIGANGFSGIDGLAWLDDIQRVPAPASLALLVLGIAGIRYQQRKIS